MTKGHRYRPCNHHPPELPPNFFFNLADLQMEPIFFQPAAKRDLGFTNQVEYVYVIISEQLAPAQSWTRCLLELHVHHCLGEPHHLLFPRLRGFPLLIATWRSRMVCLSLSAGIPGLELPEMFHEGSTSHQNVQPLSGLFSSLLEARSMFSSSIN